MKLIQSLLTEDNEAMRVDFSGSSYDRQNAVNVSMMSSTVRVSFKKMPTEITVKLDEDSGDTFTHFYKIRDALRPQLKELQAKDSEAYERIADGLTKHIADVTDNLTAELNAELDEVFEHLTTMLKARVTTFIHDHKQAMAKAADETIREARQKIDDELAK